MVFTPILEGDGMSDALSSGKGGAGIFIPFGSNIPKLASAWLQKRVKNEKSVYS